MNPLSGWLEFITDEQIMKEKNGYSTSQRSSGININLFCIEKNSKEEELNITYPYYIDNN